MQISSGTTSRHTATIIWIQKHFLSYGISEFDIQRIVRLIYSYNKAKEKHCFTNLFWYRTLHVSDMFTVHHQESSTVYTAISIPS